MTSVNSFRMSGRYYLVAVLHITMHYNANFSKSDKYTVKFNPLLVMPLVWTYLVTCISETHFRFLLKKVKNFTGTVLVNSRMHMIRNLKLLWFITKQNLSMPSGSVPHNSSRSCLLLWSAPAKHRRLMKAFISTLSVSLASLSELNLVSLYMKCCYLVLCNCPWPKIWFNVPWIQVCYTHEESRSSESPQDSEAKPTLK
jgi:hypothetical protein